MAQININFFSKTLMRQTAFTAIIPVDKFIFLPPGTPEPEKKPFKTLYLLHGIFGNCTDWMSGTRIQDYANDHNLAVIMPSGDNAFYVDNPKTGNLYGEFIGRELVEFTRDLFPLSREREDTFIAGLSMGGFGAVRNGLKYGDTFGYIGALSAGFVLDMALNSDNERPIFFRRRDYYEAIFGDIDKMMETDVNPRYIIEQRLAAGKSIPTMYVCCGTEDFLIEPNRDFNKFLNEKGIEHTYVEGPGAHDWDYWGEYILKLIKWLPLGDAEKGVSSGNVKVD
jgi:S-formylglutathione hydrolase FrmB